MDRKKTLACLIAIFLAGCSGRGRIVVGSKNFTEQMILGEIAAQQIERQLGVSVTRRLNLGGTLLAHEALVAGQIDLYPEYTGTALTAVLKRPLASEPSGVFTEVAGAYRSQWSLVWLPPLGFNDTFAMVIRGADARQMAIGTLSQAALRRDGWALGVGYEFQQRPDGLPGLQKAYSLSLKGTPTTMDLGLLYRALQQGQVDMVAGNSTDGLLSTLDVKVLDDDRKYFPPYEAAFVVGARCLSGEPRVRDALLLLSGTLSNGTMQRLNYEVDGEHQRVADVARQFLETLRALRSKTAS
jgi:glycine betaine/choline ABC-type transport system substrate-binding protein